MSLLEHPIIAGVIAAVIAGLILLALTPVVRRILRPEIRVRAAIEKGPTTTALGFTEPAVRITLANKSGRDIQITDVRLMFCGHFGASIAPEAPPGRTHPKLPASLAVGSEEHWYIPAQKLSGLLASLHRPRKEPDFALATVKLYARCMTGANTCYKGLPFSFSTDWDSDWP